MKAAAFLLIAGLTAAAQDIAPKDSERDPVLSALLENDGAEATADAVTMEPADPVLVTGNPPAEAELVEEPAEAPEPAEEPQGEPEGVAVAVQGGATGTRVEAGDVKLLAPFPAKPLAPPPAGWKIIQPDDVPAYSESVELANGTRIQLSVRPHVLVPEADGSRIFALSEPGYDPALGYAQRHTIGSVLADSIAELDRNGGRLDDAAHRLSELLDSLPAPPVATETPEQEP